MLCWWGQKVPVGEGRGEENAPEENSWEQNESIGLGKKSISVEKVV